MIRIDVTQGSPEWLKLRHGLISASRFKDILTDPRAKKDKDAGIMSATARAYLAELVAEIVSEPNDPFETDATRWGHENEDKARLEYEAIYMDFESSVETGLFLHDNLKVGASPDGLVGVMANGGMVEIKCPYNPKNHIVTVLDGMPKEHIPQVQGNMWINEREWCDFISYDPRIQSEKSLFVQRIPRNDEYINNVLAPKVLAFADKLTDLLADNFGIDWHGVTAKEGK